MNPRRILLPLLTVILAAGTTTAAPTQWTLVWQDDFNRENFIDQTKWTRIPRGKSDWDRHMSDDPACYAVKNGKLVLRGIKNTNAADPVKVITGGVTTKGKFEFTYGKVVIRAKLGAAKGAWPAFWMLSSSNKHGGYPHNGEIDIMERLNHDTKVYQTVHSNYTLNLGQKHNPPHSGTAPFNPAEFNDFGLEWYPDKLVFSVNDKPSFTYPKITTDKPGQWPFDQPFYLLIDMQLGGSWVGAIDEAQLPVQMEIDSVKVFRAANP